MDIVYFELNNWFAGRDYPNEEPFITWCTEYAFRDEEFLRENQLCVVETLIDKSVNWCVTASKDFVDKYCPKLLSNGTYLVTFMRTGSEGSTKVIEGYAYHNFLRFPDADGDVYGKHGTKFKPWSEDSIGIEYREEDDI